MFVRASAVSMERRLKESLLACLEDAFHERKMSTIVLPPRIPIVQRKQASVEPAFVVACLAIT